MAQLEEEKKAQKTKKTTDAKKNEKWDNEEVALLTLGIKKFPPGSKDRWRVIADFIQTKNPKEVIAKAKEIQEQQILDVQAKRDAATAQKDKQEQYRKDAVQKVKKQAKEAQEDASKVLETKKVAEDDWSNE